MQRSHEFPDQDALSRLMTRDNVALGVVLELLNSGRPNRAIYINNSHIHWNPSYSDVKLMQTQLLMEDCEAMMQSRSSRFQGIPMILCGDFNSTPNSAVYGFLRDGKLRPDHPEFLGFQYGRYSTPPNGGLRHPFKLASAYAAAGGEPPFSNFTHEFKGMRC